VKLYRGGSDESTFGPHLTMSNNQLNAIGEGKRNKTKASLFLHGVQVTNVKENTLKNSAPIKVEHTVGEPKTSIVNNQFSQKISVVELRVSGPHTAELSNNIIVNK
jgi:poly(beta-D-mannuronate) lyase